MALMVCDQTVTIGADGTVLTADAASTHGVKFAAAGGGGGGLTKIAQVVCSSSQATVVFSSIPATYTDLRVMMQSRDTKAGTTTSTLYLHMNADTTAGNYTGPQEMSAQITSQVVNQPATTTNGGAIHVHPNAGATTGRTGIGEIIIPNYAGTTFFKSALSQTYNSSGTGTATAIYNLSFTWASTAAITDLTFSTNGTAFLDGSIFTLYGIA